ncbi:MAG: hypothetical protein ACXV8H_07395 [Chthoniobacterales bacterium]
MKDISDKNFGVLIGFCLPGFILLYALSFSFLEVKDWLATSAAKDSLSVGGFLYSTLASLSLGLLLSAIRWFTVDSTLKLEYWMRGQQIPFIDISRLSDKDVYAAFSGVNENHYRYYQYYSNSLVALEIGFATYRFVVHKPVTYSVWALFFAVIAVLFWAARDCFRKFYERGSAVINVRVNDDQRVGTPQGGQGGQGERREEGEEERGGEDGEEDEESG